MRMPWGKFKGTCIEDLTDSYLLWLNFTANIKDASLARIISYEVIYRFHDRLPEPLVIYQDQDSNTLSIEKLKSIYRQIALEFHPDRGGDLKSMQAINLFYEKALKEMS